MAFLARHGGMQTDERETRHVMVEDDALVPFLLIVTARALLSFLALVDVIIFMAGKTGIASLLLVQITAMAVLAGHFFVGTLQKKLSILIVGEGGVLPFAGTVTAVALAAVAAGMLVVVLMTVITGSSQFNAVKLAGMAGITADGGVGAAQFEFSIPIMVEGEGLPFPFVMALLALLAIAPGMDIVDAVAGNTFGRQIFVALIWMATVAGSFLVLAM